MASVPGMSVPIPGREGGGRDSIDEPAAPIGLFAMPGVPMGSPIVGTPMGYLVRGGPPHLMHSASLRRGQAPGPAGASAEAATGLAAAVATGTSPARSWPGQGFVAAAIGRTSLRANAAATAAAAEAAAAHAAAPEPDVLLDSLSRASSVTNELASTGGTAAAAAEDAAATVRVWSGGTASLLSTSGSMGARHAPEVGLFRSPSLSGVSTRVSNVDVSASLREPLLEHPHDMEHGVGGPGCGSPHDAPPPIRVPSAGFAAPVDPGFPDSGYAKSLVFGLINAAVAMPSLVAFAAIVFKDPVYAPYLGDLCKFFFVASAVHQLVFVLLSSLPFAVGQVQDVGLIFLSAMATAIAGLAADAGLSAQVALGTSLVTMTLSTFVVGVLTILVGKLELAQMIQYVPLPVVGGYLGYVGYFCVVGGLSLGCSVEVDTLTSWVNLLTVDAAIKAVPTVASAFALIATLEHFSHPLALPGVLAAIPIAFHLVRLAAGWSLEDAMDAGWVLRPTAGGKPCWQLWDMFNLSEGLTGGGIYWGAALAQVPKVAGLFLVVCFGSCMDVAAIQQDTPRPLDFNREITTVGVSNAVVGLLGVGYTGSYIFSQTVFNMRASIGNRLAGVVLATVEFAVFAVPFSVIQYFPSFFFGALLLWFGIDISRDWLILSIRKLSSPEFALLWLTFALIMATDLERGIALGVVASTLYFAYQYAQSQVTAVRVAPAISSSMHSYELASVLNRVASRFVHCVLEGYIFFGSSTSISLAIERIADDLVERTIASGDAAGPLSDAPLFILLNFAAVSQVDATGARTFGALVNALAARGVGAVFVGVPETGSGAGGGRVRRLLAAHGVLLRTPRLVTTTTIVTSNTADGKTTQGDAQGEEEEEQDDAEGLLVCPEFPDLDSAVMYVEGLYAQMALARGMIRQPASRRTLHDLLRRHAREVGTADMTSVDAIAAALARYTHEITLTKGDVLIPKGGQVVDRLLLVQEGVLQLEAAPPVQPRPCTYSPGCWVLAPEFFLQRPSPARVVCLAGPCSLVALPRAAFLAMMVEEPQALSMLQWCMLRFNCMQLAETTKDEGGGGIAAPASGGGGEGGKGGSGV